MVSNSELYASFHHIMIPDEGPNSSEDGSGLHSPVFAGSQSAYSSHHSAGGPGGGHGDANFRYADHLDVHHGYDAPHHHHPHQQRPHQQHPQHQPQQHHNPYPPPPPQPHHSQQQHHQQQHHQSSAHHAHQQQQQQHHHQQQHLNAPPPPPSDRHHHHLGPGGGSSAYPPPPPPPSSQSASGYYHHEQQQQEHWYGGPPPPGPTHPQHQQRQPQRQSHSSSHGGGGPPSQGGAGESSISTATTSVSLSLDHKPPQPPPPPPFGMLDPHGGHPGHPLHGGPGMNGAGLAGPGGHPGPHQGVGGHQGNAGHGGGGGHAGSASPREDKKPSNTVIACRNCRSRKIRCDSTRPMCNNCVRRNNPCEYDAVPKRRGPDKRPGTRQRSCKKRPAPDDTGEGESASPVQSSQSSHHHHLPLPPPPQSQTREPKKRRTTSNHSNSHSATNPASATTGGGVGGNSNLGMGLGNTGTIPGLGGNVTALGGLSSPNATTTANGFVAGGPSDPNVGMVGGGGGSSSSSGGIVGSVSNGILPVSNGMGSVSVTGHHGHGQHGHGGLNGGPGGMTINSNANLNGVGGGGMSGGPTPARIKAEHVDGTNLALQRSPTSATSSGSYHTQQDIRSFQPPHHPSHQHFQHADHPPEIRLTDPSAYSMSYQQGYEQRGAPSAYEQKPPQLEMNHRSHWDRLVQNPGIAIIIQELEFLMEGTAHMLAFIPLEHLGKQLWSDAHRLTVHPAFIYSALALARLMRSSRTDSRGDDNRRAAMAYRTDAVRLIEESQQHRWIDLGLVEGALILAIFESSAHIEYTPANYLSSLTQLDSFIRSLALTSADRTLPNVSRFAEGGVPTVYAPTVGRELAERRTCDCLRSPAVLGTSPRTSSPSRPRPEYPPGGPNGMQGKRFIPPWPQEWTPAQIKAEEARRVCWSALDLVSAYLAQCAVDGRAGGRFWVADSAKWAVYFPGEAYESISSPSMHPHPHSPHSPSYQSQSPHLTSSTSASPMHLTPKESIWALYCRSMLLWCYTVGMREGPQPSGPQLEDQRAEEVWETWTEVQAIEDSLDSHKCNLDTGLMYATREYVHNVRMTVTQALRSLNGYDRSATKAPGPVFKRQQAEDWFYYQDLVARSILPATNALHSREALQLTQRPFRVQWFIRQLAVALQLWRNDQHFQAVLHLGKRLLQIVDVMNYLWSCPHNEGETSELRRQLSKACHEAGLEEPTTAQLAMTPTTPYGMISLHE